MLPGLDLTQPEPATKRRVARAKQQAETPRMAEAQKPDTKPLSVLLIITREDDPKFLSSATWLKDIGPWRCVDCSIAMAWMLKAEVGAAHVRLKKEGYVWEKFEGVVRVLDGARL